LTSDIRAPLFLDAFAGSGAVSRLARAMGMRVVANDWEPYSEALNACWLSLRPSDIDRCFDGDLGAVLAEWNSMHPEERGRIASYESCGEPYMARWYAPEHTDAPRFGHERLFYTSGNATFLDRVRHRLDDEYPRSEPGSDGEIRRTVVMGALLLEASVHTNTSGVFKAFHRGFGGYGKDALHRIMGRMELEIPILPELEPAIVMREDAASFAGRFSADIAYCDPPYNQHQYGSNYHILNTLLRWDGLPRPMDGAGQGGASRISGIPQDWKQTRSAFCSRQKAAGAIAALLDACDARYLVFSWNADAHLSGDDLIELLAPRGRLELLALEYVAYRGGRQSASRSVRSREYLFTVDTSRQPVGAAALKKELHGLVMIDDAIRTSYHPAAGPSVPDIESFLDETMRHPRSGARATLMEMDPERRLQFLEELSVYACADVPDELAAVYNLVMRALESRDIGAARKIASEAPRLIRKLAHAKYSQEFDRYRSLFHDIGSKTGDKRLLDRLSQLDRLKELRAGEA
jgi:adenine-specific DNA-methyltransferase